MSLARRGLSYPLTRRQQAYQVLPPRVSVARIQGAGEEELTRFVKARAKYYGWNGWHIRDSEGVIESIHSLRWDGFCEGLGVPDWYFWHERLGQAFWAELKGASGYLSKWQKRHIPSLLKGGQVCFVWYPRDAPMIERVFQYGLEGHESWAR
jgi:hypothetical protein